MMPQEGPFGPSWFDIIANSSIIKLMQFIVDDKEDEARVGKIKFNRGVINTPAFMAVGTTGVVKTMKPDELEELGAEIILGNTYHLYLRPGLDIVRHFKGLHNFIGWQKPILTDSGGYQVFSLGKKLEDRKLKNNKQMTDSLVKITNQGVWFASHLDGSKHFFTPERVIDIQLELGSDIIMPLDHCPSAEAKEEEIHQAVDRTNQWFERSWSHFVKATKNLDERPALFAIIQGGPYQKLREKSVKFLSQFPIDGWAIGGVANAGESKFKQREALKHTIPLLAKGMPRYLMGVGEPQDMIEAIGQGIDIFDCVLPTRLARHGLAWIKLPRPGKPAWVFESLDLRKGSYQKDKQPLMENCQCYGCKHFSRAYLHHLIKNKEILGIRLLTEHNLYFVFTLFKGSRALIKRGKFKMMWDLV